MWTHPSANALASDAALLQQKILVRSMLMELLKFLAVLIPQKLEVVIYLWPRPAEVGNNSFYLAEVARIYLQLDPNQKAHNLHLLYSYLQKLIAA